MDLFYLLYGVYADALNKTVFRLDTFTERRLLPSLGASGYAGTIVNILGLS